MVRKMQRWLVWQSRRVVDAAAMVILLVAAASTLWLYPNWSRLFPASNAPPVPEEPISLQGATLRGNPKARVVLIEYSDYQCPFCRIAETSIVPQLNKQYVDPGSVQVAFRHAPLDQLHPRATKAAEAALCAGRQGQFWKMHAALFADQRLMDDASLMTRARALELDVSLFGTCLEGAVVNQVKQDSREAEELGLRGTPAFLIGTRVPDGRVRVTHVLVGAQPIEAFQKALDAAGRAQKSLPLVRLWLTGVGVALIVGLGLRIRRARLQLDTVTH